MTNLDELCDMLYESPEKFSSMSSTFINDISKLSINTSAEVEDGTLGKIIRAILKISQVNHIKYSDLTASSLIDIYFHACIPYLFDTNDSAEFMTYFKWLNPIASLTHYLNTCARGEEIIDSFTTCMRLRMKDTADPAQLMNIDNAVDAVLNMLSNESNPIESILAIFKGTMALPDTSVKIDMKEIFAAPEQSQGYSNIIYSSMINAFAQNQLELIKCSFSRIMCNVDIFDTIVSEIYAMATTSSTSDRDEIAHIIVDRLLSSITSNEDDKQVMIAISSLVSYCDVFSPLKLDIPVDDTTFTDIADNLIDAYKDEITSDNPSSWNTIEDIVDELVNVGVTTHTPAPAVNVIPVVNSFGIKTIAVEAAARDEDPYNDDKAKDKITSKNTARNVKAEKNQKDFAEKAKNVQAGAYKAYKQYGENKEKIDSVLAKITKGLKDAVLDTNAQKTREETIGGKKYSPIDILTKVCAGAAIFSMSKVAFIIITVARYYSRKNCKAVERKKAIIELEHEIKITDEKIQDAQSAGDTKAKYALMRARNELDSALQTVKSSTKVSPDKEREGVKNSLLNVEVHSGK